MNLPTNIIDRPSIETIETFVETVKSIGDAEKRALYAVSNCTTFEIASKVSGVPMLELSAVVAHVARCKPRDETMEFDHRSSGYFFKQPLQGQAFAEVMKFVAAFSNWCREPDVAKALTETEGRRVALLEARRAA